MTLVEFRFDPESLTQDLRYHPETADPAVLETTYFIMPVRFSINGVELLQGVGPDLKRPDPWVTLPVLGFATHVLEALHEMGPHSTREVSLADGGTLYLAREGDQLSLVSTSCIDQKTVTTNLADLIDAFRVFLGKVRAMLLSHVPGIDKHPFWDQWFSNK